MHNGSVAQLNRAMVSGTMCHGFESHRSHFLYLTGELEQGVLLSCLCITKKYKYEKFSFPCVARFRGEHH